MRKIFFTIAILITTIIQINAQSVLQSPVISANSNVLLVPQQYSTIQLAINSSLNGLFNFPLDIGTTWIYNYDYSYFHLGDWAKRKGIHTWEVIDSSTFISGFTRFSIRSLRKDTISSYYNPTPHLVIDTTYFYIDRGSDVIIVRPPSFVSQVVDNIQGYFSGDQTVQIGGRVYKERLGLVSLFDSNYTNTYYRESLKLIEFNGYPQ